MLQGFVALLLFFFFPNLFYLVVGFFLCKTDRFHAVGVRMLAMSVLCSGRFVSWMCRQDCRNTRCGNWTCENYHHCKN